MIGSRTPFRMSFIGGGCDLKEFYSHSPGSVLSTTINKYMYIFIHPFFDNRIQVKYSKTELVDRIIEIEHPIVRVVLQNFDINGIDINSIADIPAGTGLGSSSSFTVGLLHAMYSYTNEQVSSELLAKIACDIEIDILKEPIGKQDQYAAAFGGFNVIRFFPTGKVKVEPVNMQPSIYNQLETAIVIDITNEITPFNIQKAAYVVRNCFKDFPIGTVHIISVDDELTINNEHVAVKANGHYFVGPDNGLFSLLLNETKAERIVKLNITQTTNCTTFATKNIFDIIPFFASTFDNLSRIIFDGS